ncbi:methylated-DNA--[protein]-cysteine S-methyltransferase [Ectothiorhodospiraceae bacterium BW-2]|nr:methylated-DNA--[protein]-cysteine S-methyltransferase [Ectothiorhodospiraceae bacterium BW-2]
MRYEICHTPFTPWQLSLQWSNDEIEQIEWCRQQLANSAPPPWLAAYFKGEHQALLEAPYRLQGTPFQRRLWQHLQQIPAGEPCHYGAIAAKLGTSARAVAAACRANRLALVIPCHRVVASCGLGGYMGALAGDEVALKQQLLQWESHRG